MSDTPPLLEQLEKHLKPHGDHCLAGKYSTMGRCSCGRDKFEAQLLQALRVQEAARKLADNLGKVSSQNLQDGIPRSMASKICVRHLELVFALSQSNQEGE